jgi:hypothetical protein
MLNLGSPALSAATTRRGHERSIWLMEDQFIYFPVRTEEEFHSEARQLLDEEGSALVGTEFIGGLAANCQREVPIAVLPDNDSRGSVAERADAPLRKVGFVQSPAEMRVNTISLTSGSNGAARLAMFPSRSVENEMASRSGSRRPAASGSSNVS